MGHIADADWAIFPKFQPYWGDFTPFVREIKQLCFPASPREPNSLTYKDLAEILIRAKSAVTEPPYEAEPLPAKRQYNLLTQRAPQSPFEAEPYGLNKRGRYSLS